MLHGAAQPDRVRVAVGFSIGPYMLQDGKGIIGDLITESLRNVGLDPDFSYQSNMSAIESFEAGETDAVTVVKKGMVEGHYSRPLVTFQNYTWALSGRKIEIRSLDDLVPYRVAAFSSANRFLSPEFERLTEKLAGYQEIDDQQVQISALFKGEFDVIIADETIFKYYHKRLVNSAPQDETWRQPVSRGYAFPPNAYHVAFSDAQIRDRFDTGLAALQANGRSDEIRQLYLGLLDTY